LKKCIPDVVKSLPSVNGYLSIYTRCCKIFAIH
jgi:hypothetical protein